MNILIVSASTVVLQETAEKLKTETSHKVEVCSDVLQFADFLTNTDLDLVLYDGTCKIVSSEGEELLTNFNPTVDANYMTVGTDKLWWFMLKHSLKMLAKYGFWGQQETAGRIS